MYDGEKDAERLIQACGPGLGLPVRLEELEELRKGDPRKALMAAALRQRTTVGFDWIAKRLVMGHPGPVRRLVSLVNHQQKLKKQFDEMDGMS